jgi:hypothetical protein
MGKILWPPAWATWEQAKRLLFVWAAEATEELRLFVITLLGQLTNASKSEAIE